MICPKCKTKVSEEDTTCPACNLRLIFKCPRCGSPTRLGSVSCKKCGYTFVKFCPECHSANYASSSICRKCGAEFPSEQTESDNIKFKVPNEQTKQNISQNKIQQSNIADSKKENIFIFYINFLNLERVYEKLEKDEFKQKIAENIKTTVKIAFGMSCRFIDNNVAMFKFRYNKGIKILEKIEQFESEFSKFNEILNKTINTTLTYKFALTTLDEARKNNAQEQLELGNEKDVIISKGTYAKLNSDLSLIKISPNSYKLIFLKQKPTFEQSEDEKYDKALKIILDNIADSNSEVRIISVNAPSGVGKTYLLNNLYCRIYAAKTINSEVLYAQCSAMTQVGAFGLIQNLFLNFFELPSILSDKFDIKAFEKRVLDKLELEKIENTKLKTLANIIYPIQKDYYENILINKRMTNEDLRDIFNYIKSRKNLTLIIDDFDLIDESSYNFIKYLVYEGFFEKNAKLIVSYKNEHSISIYFQTNKLTNKNTMNISLRKFNNSECKIFIKKALGENHCVPNEIVSQIAMNSNGNIAYIEQTLQYLFERKILFFQDNKVHMIPNTDEIKILPTLEECAKARLMFLKENFQKEYKFLCLASLLGDKLDYKILSDMLSLNENEFFEIIQKLDKKGYLKKKLDDIYGFKNSLVWTYCYSKAKEEQTIKDDVNKLLLKLNDKTLATPLVCPILAQISDNNELAFNLWTNSLQKSGFIGDVNAYTMAQKQCLILLEKLKLDNFDYIKDNICERLGKLTYYKNPHEAKDYLSNAIMAAQKNNDINKVIDLSGYLTKSAYLTQDYTAVVEVVDNILKYFSKKEKAEKKSTYELQIALIKTKKLDALLELGYWEEIASLVNSEINPVLQKNMSFFKKNKWISKNEIFYSWIEANIILAQSFSQQGSPLANELISEIEKVLLKEKDPKIDILKVRLKYATAMANTAKGYADESDFILQEIVQNYSYLIDTPVFVSKWNIISITNKILRLDYKTIKEELFEASAYANNCGDEVSKNILKTFLAYILLEEKAYLKAIEVATEELRFFSTKKIAFGALLAWYISAAATLANKADMYCIEICEKAVKICENAQNNNNYFKILFQELLSKAYLKLNDLENAQMYCDLAIQSANINDLIYLQLRLHELKATIAREKLNSQPDDKKLNFALNVMKIYEKTIAISKKLNFEIYTKKIEKELVSFKAHCQLNRIIEDKQR